MWHPLHCSHPSLQWLHGCKGKNGLEWGKIGQGMMPQLFLLQSSALPSDPVLGTSKATYRLKTTIKQSSEMSAI